LRYFIKRDGALLNMVLRIFLRVIEQSLASGLDAAALAQRQASNI
jgi:hypothetical protein